MKVQAIFLSLPEKNLKNTFFDFRKAPKLNFMDWCKFLEEVAKTKKMNVNIIKVKLLECSKPGNTGTVRLYFEL